MQGITYFVLDIILGPTVLAKTVGPQKILYSLFTYIVQFQKMSIPPTEGFFILTPHPLEISVPEGL